MSGDFVLDFTDAMFGVFFKHHSVNIHGDQYQIYGTSNAKIMRMFWEKDPDFLVDQVLSDVLDYNEVQCESSRLDLDPVSLGRSREDVARFCGNKSTRSC